VIFSDESLFTREGIFNSHNMHLWSDENARVTRFTRGLYDVIPIDFNETRYNGRYQYQVILGKEIRCNSQAFAKKSEMKMLSAL